MRRIFLITNHLLIGYYLKILLLGACKISFISNLIARLYFGNAFVPVVILNRSKSSFLPSLLKIGLFSFYIKVIWD